MPSIIMKTNRKNLDIVAQGKIFPSFRDIFNIFSTFSLITLSWIFFRSETMSQAVYSVKNIFSTSFFEKITLSPSISLILLTLFFIIVEWIGREQQYALEKLGLKWKRWLRWLFYYILVFLIFALSGSAQEFIYFQF
jgi:hypothetical protein